METVYLSDVDTKWIDTFYPGYPYRSYVNYVANFVSIDNFIAVVGLLSPSFIEVNGFIFLKDHYYAKKILNESRFGNDRKTKERYINLFCLSDLYLLAANELSNDKKWQIIQAELIAKFWKQRLKEVFPTKDFEVEVLSDGQFDENEVCVTFSQK